MRNLGLIALIIALFISLFKYQGAELTNNVLLLALMVLLAILFPDLKEFDFWGLKGKQKEQELKELEGKVPVVESSGKKRTKVQKTKVEEARQQTVIQPDEPSIGHFLTLSFEIERLIKIIAAALTDPVKAQTPQAASQILFDQGILTQDGMRQIEAIRDLVKFITDGRAQDITPEVLESATKIAYDLYLGLKGWLSQP